MDFAVKEISSLDATKIRQVLTSPKISETEKIQFIRKNSDVIRNTLSISPDAVEYARMMKNRPLEKFKPIKNSFTKRGDKILLSKTLGISPSEVDDYLKNVTETTELTNKLSFLSDDKLSAIKTYAFRHGSTDMVSYFLEYDLKNSRNKVKAIYRNLEYHSGGMADYYIRPIHRMSNKTLINLYQIFDKSIVEAQTKGDINKEESMEISRYAIKRLYEIQNNSKFINSIKTYNALKS